MGCGLVHFVLFRKMYSKGQFASKNVVTKEIRMRKIIIFERGIETLSFFSAQLAIAWKQMGISIFSYQLDVEDETRREEQLRRLKKFCKTGETMVVTFNFNGLRGEEELYRNGELFWAREQIPCVNIMVDHPFYYPELLDKVKEELGVELYYQVLIDRDHKKFVERFYPEIIHTLFLPLAGTGIEWSWEKKKYDVVFTGNYTPPSQFRTYIDRIDEEYTRFYEGILKDLITHPCLTMEEAFEKHLKQEMGDLSDEDLKICMGKMIFLDLYVRFYFRGEIIRTLAEADVPVHVWGAGWDALECEKAENIIIEGPTDTQGCLEALAKAKIALNVMPWFKDGAHDRVFSAMQNGAVCVTDESIYLKQELCDGEDVVFYSLKEYKKLPQQIKHLLEKEETWTRNARNGYDVTKEKHVWKERAEVILKWMEQR